jgi:hypothetical protein
VVLLEFEALPEATDDSSRCISEDRDLARKHERVACSIYGKLEVHAALHRKFREGDITKEQMETIFLQFDLDESQRLWDWLSFTAPIMAAACHFGIEGKNVMDST